MFMLAYAMASDSYPSTQQLEVLLSEVGNGNREALEQLYLAVRTSVYGLALSYLKNGHDAEDVTQDTFVRVWEYALSYRPQGKPLAWILAIAKNLALMKLRSSEKSNFLSSDEWESLAIDSPTITAEDREVLLAAINQLSDQERQIILLHAVSGLKHREIASLVDLSLPTVLSKYHRGLKKLKSILEREDRHD